MVLEFRAIPMEEIVSQAEDPADRDPKSENPDAARLKSRLGIILFFVYLAVYAGFVAINTVRPKLMQRVVIAGLNLAVVYGFGLILLAIIMGLIYNALCLGYERRA